jgi:peroxiredoxin
MYNNKISKFIIFSFLLVIISCKNEGKTGKLDVSGKIEKSTANMVYLEEVPMATRERIIVDSSTLGEDGKYELSAEPREHSVFNLRLAGWDFPIASVVNDASKITINAKFSDDRGQVINDYEVKGSKASEQLKDFMKSFNTELQKIYFISMRGDSLQKAGSGDSLLIPLYEEHTAVAERMKKLVNDAIAKSENPALTMFVLGTYQTTANNPGFGLKGLDNAEVKTIIDDLYQKFPDHSGLASIRQKFNEQQQSEAQQASATMWVGKTAPEISLPDVNGNEVKLSSYRGKYVLVDFWASWCTPCRYENPAVVKAYQRFKDKNFDILGVSLDQKKDAWLKAIKDDKLTWTQVSDLAGWESVVVPVYNFGQVGIPYNVLLDPEGKVIAEKLRGAALEEKLAEVLK